jgi:two-component system, OmpR family, sensor histidine kinase SenX3
MDAAALALLAGVVIGVSVGIAVGRVTRHGSIPRSAPSADMVPDAQVVLPSSVADTEEVAELRASLDALAVGVVVVDRDGREITRNRTARDVGGSRHSNVLVEEAVEVLLAAAIGGARRQQVLELLGPPRRSLVISSTPLEPAGALVTIDDVTERTRLDAVRTDFVANISHELRTPVGALSLLAEAIADSDDPALVRRLAERMVGECERVSATIDDLLELSRIELGGEAVADPVRVELLVDEACERIRAAAEHVDIELVCSAPPGLSVLGDRRQLASALGNLIDNAVKYSERGGIVRVTAELVDGRVEIAVSDDGIGIPGRDIDRIFERFYRVDRARSRHTGGTGLGLAIVRHVVTNHRGDVRVSSQEGAGSTFTLVLPRAIPEEQVA